MKHKEVLESDELAIQETTILDVEAKALLCLRALGICKDDPQVKRLQHISVAELAIRF